MSTLAFAGLEIPTAHPCLFSVQTLVGAAGAGRP
jgi:hypothetical protein